MEIIFHSRHAVLAEDFRSIVTEKLKTLQRFGVAVDGFKVEIIHESNPRFGKSSHSVNLSSHGSGPFLRAEGQAFNDLAAFDMAVKNLELQLRKIHERAKDYDHETVRVVKE
jgi:ribosomal subunit interface protein